MWFPDTDYRIYCMFKQREVSSLQRSLKRVGSKLIAAGLMWACMCAPVATLAADPLNIQVLGLFRDKAAVKINGERVLLETGVPTEQGVLLIRSNAKRAIIEIDGVQKSYGLGSDVSTRLSKPVKKTVRIPSNRGMYLTHGLINGRSVNFLVDTGASAVAMGRVTADRLQIPYRETGRQIRISTAAAVKRGWRVMLDSVTVGGITVNQVEGTVIDTAHDNEILLGMSFLRRIKVTQEEGIVVLEARVQQ